MGQAVRDLADELQVSSLYDWPCVGAQRVHALYRWSWVPNGAGEPVCAVGLGWHWGTLLDGRTTGNDGTRPYVAVTAQPRQLEAVTRAVGGLVPPGRQAAHRLCGYPSWFWLPAAPATGAQFGQEARQALLEAWGSWAVVLDDAVAESLK